MEDDEIRAETKPELSKKGRIEIKKQGLISLIGCNFSFVGDIQSQVLSCISEAKISLVSYSKAKRNFNIAVQNLN